MSRVRYRRTLEEWADLALAVAGVIAVVTVGLLALMGVPK